MAAAAIAAAVVGELDCGLCVKADISSMSDSVTEIVIVGGGSAGWLTAGLLAAEHCVAPDSTVTVTLVESPDIKPIGVGEGTWPTMRTSLQSIGVSETDFVRECDASFKQGTRFSGWLHGEDDVYYHPFALPQKMHEVDLARYWQKIREDCSYADAVTPQSHVCEQALAPKQITTPEFAGNLNYGYHLDAGKFAAFLERHCKEILGVRHILENVVGVNSTDGGDVDSLALASGDTLSADLFVDCTGFSARLIGKHFNIPMKEKKSVLFNDRALAVQVPRASDDEPIASATHSTATAAGWIWDIALPTRRGVGHVYSSAHTSDTQAEAILRAYIADYDPTFSESCSVRLINFEPGYRETLWHRNCVAIGLSGGFVEPLEASALVMVEQAAMMLTEQLPANRATMDIVAAKFNRKFAYHWQRIIEFLKLHYVLSERADSEYWLTHRDVGTIPSDLSESLALWRHRSPRYHDLPLSDELFPAASYRYVLNGMRFDSEGADSRRQSDIDSQELAQSLFDENVRYTSKALAALPSNRALIEKIHQFGFQKV